MKKLIVFAILFSFVHFANSQESDFKQNFIVGGTFNLLVQKNTYPFSSISSISGIGGIYSNGTDNTKNKSFSISPYIGKELNPSLTVGMQLDFRVARYSRDEAVVFSEPEPVRIERNTNQFAIGIFSRHTLNAEKKFSVFVQPSIEFNFLNEKSMLDSTVTEEEEANFLEVAARLGLLYNINNRARAILRVGGLTYINGTWEIKDSEIGKDFSSLGVSMNLSNIFFGFEIRV